MEDKTIKLSDRILGLSKQTALVVAFIVWTLVSMADFCLAEPNHTTLADEQRRAILLALEGEWICNIGSVKVRLQLTDDHKFSLNDKEGRYIVDGNKFTLESGSSETLYDFELGQNQLTLSGGDLNQPLKFTKLLGMGRSKKWFSALSVKSLQAKLYRILLVVIVVILCRIAIILFRVIIHFIIYSDWGPLRFIYRQQKNRTMTIYSLVISDNYSYLPATIKSSG